MKQSVRKRADRVIMMGVEVMYKKNSDEVRIIQIQRIQSREEQMRVLEVWHSDPTSGHFGVKKTFNQVRKSFYWKGMFKDAERSGSLDKMTCTSVLHAPNGTTTVACCVYY